MLQDAQAFSGFSVSNIGEAKAFYGDVLGVRVEQTPEGLSLHLADGTNVFLYEKPNHQAASYTVLNFIVSDIDAVVDGLMAKGVNFEHYTGDIQTDEKGVARSNGDYPGPTAIAWCKDPAGNIISVLQE